MIKSHLLYQLSYAPGTSPEILGSGRRRLAKRTRDVQQRAGAFPLCKPLPQNTKKPPESGGFSYLRR
jgi:hypothetical protein